MKFYRMSDKVALDAWDGRERPVLYKRSHDLMQTKTGEPFVDYTDDDEGAPFTGELACELDDEDRTGILPTFFMSPALIGTRQFHRDLLGIGIRNIEVQPVAITDPAGSRVIDGYLVLNVLGCVPFDAIDPARNLAAGDGGSIGLDLFLLREDTDWIIVSERVFQYLAGKGYDDVHFEEIGPGLTLA